MVSIGQMLVFAMLTSSAHLVTDLEMREPGWPQTPRELPASASGVLSEINAVLHQDGLEAAGPCIRRPERGAVRELMHACTQSFLGPSHSVQGQPTSVSPYSDGLPTAAIPTNKTPPKRSYRPA